MEINLGLEILDYSATHIKSPIHLSSTLFKVVFCCITITLLLLTKSFYFPFLVLVILLITLITNKIPVFKVLHLLFYPIFFSGIFAFGTGYNLAYGLWLITKTVTIATTMILLLSTTPIYNLFNLLHRFLPNFIIDGLFFTYRSFFIFQKLFSNLFLTIKIKGGYGKLSILKNLKNIGGAVAITFIRALDSAERMKEVFYIRGYEIGNIKVQENKATLWNIYPVFLSAFVLVLYFWV